MTTFPNNPELWRYIIKECAKYFEFPIIAGGAIRDWYLGQEPKDIDVFVWGVNEFDSGRFFHFMEDPKKAEEYEAMGNILCVWEGTLCEHTINIILIDDTQTPRDGSALVATFDFGITRSWFDGELHDSYEARTDRKMHTVTLLIKDRPERAKARFNRFNQRNGNDWKMVE